MKPAPVVLALLFTIGALHARTWTSAEGKSLEAEFVSATDSHVTIQRVADGRSFTLALDQLSKSDCEWVAAEIARRKAAAKHPLPEAVAKLVDSRGSVLFEDSFDREDAADVEDLGPDWATNSRTRAQGDKQNDLVDGVLVMTISPRADHAISTKHEAAEPYQDAVVYVRLKLEDGEELKLAYNDLDYKEVWAGHINGVTINPKSLLIADEKSARFDLKFRDIKDTPEGKAALAQAQASAEKRFPLELKTGEWHDVVTVHQADTLTVFIDGQQAGSHQSPGFGHETKRQFAFAVPKRAQVDDLKIWKLAEP